MATISGTYRETTIATIAAMITLINAHLTAEDARMIALGGAATSIIGTLTLTVKAESGTGALFNHKITVSFNCAALANAQAIVSALSTFATAVETQSPYTTVVEVEASMTTTMSN